MHFGVDVSSNNPHPINWQAIAQWARQAGGGNDPFAFIKISEGTDYVNPDIAVDVAAARAAGFHVAGYLFDHGSVPVAGEETEFQAHSLGMPQMDDIEAPDGLTAEQYVQHAQDLVALDRSALVYLNLSEVAEGFPADRLYLAEWDDNPASATKPCLVKQFTDKLVVPGANGTFDGCSWLGTEDQFNQYFGVNPQPAPAPQPAPQAPPWPGRLLRQPPVMDGADVREWQQRMYARGWHTVPNRNVANAHPGAPFAVDGAYGPNTESVCRAFQQQKGLTDDGIVGPVTWDAAWTTPVTPD
jgi:peptidoglycan hydrolase-like protein with peptidoglycan-binding domain